MDKILTYKIDIGLMEFLKLTIYIKDQKTQKIACE